MSKKLSLKEYLTSKDCLRAAAQDIPKTVLEYEVKKYCKIPVGYDDSKHQINLKPRNKLFIKWLCEEHREPRAIEITFEDIDGDDINEVPSWNNKKLLKWLVNNTDNKSSN